MSIKKLLKLEDSTKLGLPAAVYTNEREYISGAKPFATLKVDSNGKFHLTINEKDEYPVKTKGVIILERSF